MKDKKGSTSAEILDQCISCLRDDDAATQTLLDDHAQQGQDLASLVEIARQIQAEFSVPISGEGFICNSKIRLLNRLRATQTPRKPARSRRQINRRLAWRPARVFVSIFFAFMLVLSSTGVAWASNDAIPGDTLYPLKRGMEELRLGFTFSESGDVALLNTFTSERMNEIEALILTDDDEYLLEALQNYDDMLDRLVDQVLVLSQSDAQYSLDELQSNFTHQLEILEQVKANMPADIQARMEETQEQTQHGKDVVEYVRQGGNPSDLAPGQQNKLTPQSESDEETHGSGKTKTPKPKKEKTPGPPPWANPGGQDKKEED